MKEVKRPWGLFKQFVLNKKCTVKVLIVNPKQVLSLQKHRKRNEMWYFFDKAVVQINEKKIHVKEGDLIKIKKGTAHRIISKSNKIKVLEISTGKFEEHDEIRFEDKYKRK